MNHRDWLQYTDIVMARHAFSGVCLAKVFEDRVQQMPQEDYQALLAQLDDPAIATWVRRTREEQALVLQT